MPTKTTITKVTTQVTIRSFMSKTDDTTYSTPETITRIIYLTKGLTDFGLGQKDGRRSKLLNY